MESVADDVPFNDGLDADGNIIADGAEYLASLAIQNAEKGSSHLIIKTIQ
jgi:hypothetical protein